MDVRWNGWPTLCSTALRSLRAAEASKGDLQRTVETDLSIAVTLSQREKKEERMDETLTDKTNDSNEDADHGFVSAPHCVEGAAEEPTEVPDTRGERKAQGALEDADDRCGIIARSSAMRELVAFARRVARVDSTILITGESGAGKERFARLLHEESSRASGPFVAVNCGAIAETLLEGELFGHARGSFTGALADRPGLFEAASGGTLFLDEIGEVSPSMQVKLLRALQEREIRRVGENKSRRFDVRIVTATNRDLPAAIIDGSFRQDLYYRLKVVEIGVPPLRDRKDDILPLANLLLLSAACRMKRDVSGLSEGASTQLLGYHWPGNVRELENAMERAAALSGSTVELEDLPEEIRHASCRTGTAERNVRSLEQVEREYILAILALNGGNQTHTAKQLQIGSATLYRKLKSYGLIEDRVQSPGDRIKGLKRKTHELGETRLQGTALAYLGDRRGNPDHDSVDRSERGARSTSDRAREGSDSARSEDAA